MTQTGSTRRVYPAPAPAAAPLNVDHGWDEGATTANNSYNSNNGYNTSQQPIKTERNDRQPPPHLSNASEAPSSPALATPATPASETAAPKGGYTYVPWEPVK